MARFVSDELKRVIQDSGRMICDVEVKSADNELILSSTYPLHNLDVIGGSIATDSTRDIPGSGSIEILINEATFDQVMPYGARSPLSPVSNSVVYVSFRGESGESTPYGAYDIAETEADEGPDGVKLTLEVFDNARKIQNAKFHRPRVVRAGTSWDDAFKYFISGVLPRAEINIAPNTHKTGLITWDIEGDRLTAVKNLVLWIAYYIDWNDNGIGDVYAGPRGTTERNPAWTFVHQDADHPQGNARIYRATRRLSDEDTYNGVIISGESTGSGTPPVRAEVWDTDPTSPTYFDPAKPTASDFGPKPLFETSIFAFTNKHALAIAKEKLPQTLGVSERITIETMRHPGITPEDTVQAERPTIKITGNYVVESVNMPLTSGMMTVTCRERRIVD